MSSIRTVLFLIFSSVCIAAAEETDRPNIILFLIDDMGPMDTSVPLLADADGVEREEPLNGWYRTPQMERLAERGIRFTNFYAHTVCSPTRSSIMTGQNSARHRTTQFISPRFKNTGDYGPEAWNWEGLTSEGVTLPGVLRDAGYRTIHIGKAHFGPPENVGEDPTNLGFDVNVGGGAMGQPGSYWGQDGYGNLIPERQTWAVPGMEKYYGSDTFLTEALTLEAKAEIDRSLADDMPFYLYMSHYAVHTPFQADPRFVADYEGPEYDERSRAYATLVAGIDKSLGDLMDHLEARGIAENTLIVFMGDNGSDAPIGAANDIGSSAPLRGKKASRWEGGSRVPFIAAWGQPQADHSNQQLLPIKAGGIQTQMGLCYDVFPTFLRLAGADAPGDHAVDGRDLKPLLAGGPDAARPEVFLSHFPHEHRNSYFTTYREGDWKLVYQYFPPTEDERYALYHLGRDLSESVDLSDKHPEKLRALTAAMIDALGEMDALYPVVDGVPQRPRLPSDLFGYWTLDVDSGEPAWLRVEEQDGQPVATMRLYVGPDGPYQDARIENGELKFTLRDRRIKKGSDVMLKQTVTASVKHGKLHGVIDVQASDGSVNQQKSFTGRRVADLPIEAPDLSKVTFGHPIALFNGKDLSGWRAHEADKAFGWSVIDGLLVNTTPKTDFSATGAFANLRTEAEFEDFWLHIEFLIEADRNSGVYLRGMWEAQVVDRDSRMQGLQGVGAIFSRIAPSVNAGREPGEWQTYDLTLVDGHVTVVLNGVTVIDNQPVGDPTGGAIYTDIQGPGPIYLQGDHTSVKYRDIYLAPVVR